MHDTELLNEFDNALEHTDHLELDEIKELFLTCLYSYSTGNVRNDIDRLIKKINGGRKDR